METRTQVRIGTAPAKSRQAARPSPIWTALTQHWPEYLMESAGLGIFMISACVFTVILEHPSSPVHQAIESPLLRRALIGIAMGGTFLGIFFSPWGKRSGAHLNPAVTLTFLSLGKMERADAFFYIAAQFAGGILGVVASALAIGLPLRHDAVNFAVTVPGSGGPSTAFWAEALISFLMMATVLTTSNLKSLTRFTPIFASALVAVYITIEAPFSGMSMNPARTLGSAVPASEWTALWIYFTAPLFGMFLAGMIYRNWRGVHKVFCAKINHHNNERCIFRCNYEAL